MWNFKKSVRAKTLYNMLVMFYLFFFSSVYSMFVCFCWFMGAKIGKFKTHLIVNPSFFHTLLYYCQAFA